MSGAVPDRFFARYATEVDSTIERLPKWDTLSCETRKFLVNEFVRLLEERSEWAHYQDILDSLGDAAAGTQLLRLLSIDARLRAAAPGFSAIGIDINEQLSRSRRP